MFALPKIGLKVNILRLLINLEENAFAEQSKGIFENSICDVNIEKKHKGR
jgi:hypothetical protein